MLKCHSGHVATAGHLTVIVSASVSPDIDDMLQKHMQDPVTAGCGHTFCRGCIREFMDSAAAEGAVQCPTCSRPLTVAMDQARSAPPAELQSMPSVQDAPGQMS
jgi:zinc finger of C3HC4-type, RING